MQKIYLRKSQLAYFRKKAKQSPLEIEAYLIGRTTKTKIVIEQFVYPKRYKIQTPSAVLWSDEDYNALLSKVKTQNKVLIGSIHSHPNWDNAMSETDYDSHIQNNYTTTGVCAIHDKGTWVRFWKPHSALPLRIVYY